MALPAVLQKILDWLHAGYPLGVPQRDYFPLLAFLARHLTEEEVLEVVTALRAEQDPAHVPSREEIIAAIEAVTKSPPLEEDIRHVETVLREAGWDPIGPVGPAG